MKSKTGSLNAPIALLAASVLIAMPPIARAETIERVLAVVGAQVITLTDVTAARDLGLQPAAATGDPVRAILSRLIDRALMLAEVARYAPPEPSTAAIDRELAAVRRRFASDADYRSALERSGVDEQHLREMLRQDLWIRAYQDQRFSPSDARRQALIDEWVAGLRRRGTVVDLYLTDGGS